MNQGRVALFLVALLLTGCGYAFQGTVNHTPDGIRRITIPTVTNTTTYTELTFNLTNYVIQRFNMSQGLKVTQPDDAEASLNLSITAVQIDGGARAQSNEASVSRRVSIIVSGSLKRIDNGRKLWEVNQLIGRRNYTVTNDQSIVETNLNKAMDIIAEELAQKIHDNIIEDF
ncbi:MAG: hypothetical protein HQK55_04485 [Deltaproteobacteria bacterium]|nr:hypothetical protein [Deltaproteobacteria bacterium]